MENRSYSFFKKPYFTGFFGARTAESEYDFESVTSANSITPARCFLFIAQTKGKRKVFLRKANAPENAGRKLNT